MIDVTERRGRRRK